MSDQRAFIHNMKNYLGIILGYSQLVLDEIASDDPRRADIEEIRKAGECAVTIMERWISAAASEDAKPG